MTRVGYMRRGGRNTCFSLVCRRWPDYRRLICLVHATSTVRPLGLAEIQTITVPRTWAGRGRVRFPSTFVMSMLRLVDMGWGP